MIGLFKNEWIKLFNNKKLYGFLLVMFVTHMLPVIFTLFLNMKTLNGQVFPLNMFAVITTFVMPIFLIVVVAEIVTEELLSGNLALSLVHPVTRGQVIAAKVIFVFTLILLLQVISLVFAYTIGTVIFGWGSDFMLRGSTYPMLLGVYITIAAYLSAVIPLWVFSLLIIFIAVIIQGGAAVVGIAAGLFMLFNILNLLADEIRLVLINTYFNTVPLVLAYLDNPSELLFPALFMGCFAVIFYLLTVVVVLRKDMVN